MVKKTQPIICPLGDSAVIINYEPAIAEAVNRRVLATSHAIKEACFVGVKDIVPAYSSITVHYDVVAVRKKYRHQPAFVTIKEQLETLLFQSIKDLPQTI
ncbi:carboxyltransferase domain-containing protein, partial [Segetibacter sp.]|uniref:carboxyltransferase domain-containing protein n=1 Tax=Segetibacter sp. TaxID=2231182 RepID=UPI002619C34F